MEKLKVAVISSNSKFCDVETNLNHFKLLIEKASLKKARLICFPELALSCYTNKNNILNVVQEIPGQITEKLQILTKKYCVYLSIGCPEKSGSKFYISQIVLGPQGYIGKYRKNYINKSEQKCGFSAGKGFPTFMIDDFKMGINIGLDARQTDTIDIMKDVNFIHHPHGNYMIMGSNAEEWTRGKTTYFVSRAVQTRAYLLINCLAGDTIEMGEKKSHSSGALIIDPLGQVLKRTAQKTRTEKILTCDIIKPLSALIPDFEMNEIKNK